MAHVVYGEGPHSASVMLIGQNPGAEEGRQGRPFVGQAGQYLNEVLQKNCLERNKLYVTNVVKEVTPGNREPTAKEIKYWLPYLMQEIRDVRPRIIVLMGRVARRVPRLEGIDYIETYHPAAAMRFPKARKKFEEDFQGLGELVDSLSSHGRSREEVLSGTRCQA